MSCCIFRAAVCAVTGSKKDDLSLPLQLVCGAAAGVTFWSGIFPLDVIKSRIQVFERPDIRNINST